MVIDAAWATASSAMTSMWAISLRGPASLHRTPIAAPRTGLPTTAASLPASAACRAAHPFQSDRRAHTTPWLQADLLFDFLPLTTAFHNLACSES